MKFQMRKYNYWGGFKKKNQKSIIVKQDYLFWGVEREKQRK